MARAACTSLLSKHPAPTQPAPQSGGLNPLPHRPWTLPAQGLAVFHGHADTARLSHYFLPRLLLQGKRILFLDGANCADPRLLERLARQRNVPFAQFNRQIEIARAFTCFQLTELIARVPQFLVEFPAEVLVVTAFPDLYFDEDVRDGDARGAFERALRDLRRWAGAGRGEGRDFSPAEKRDFQKYTEFTALPTAGLKPRPSAVPLTLPLAVALFSSATTFTPTPARRRFFAQTCASAGEVWEFTAGADSRLILTCTQQAQLEQLGD